MNDRVLICICGHFEYDHTADDRLRRHECLAAGCPCPAFEYDPDLWPPEEDEP